MDSSTREAYRRTFNTPDGKAVLTDILNDLGLYSAQIETPGDVALQNYARKLLFKLGAWREANIFLLTQGFMELPWEDQTNNEEAP